MKYITRYLALFLVTMLFGFGVYFVLPTHRDILLLEDSLLENLSAFIYLMSSFVGLIFFLKSKTHRKVLVIVSAVGLLGFLEELSFGERLFGLNMPRFYGIKFDGVHDLFGYLGFRVIRNFVTSYPIVMIVLLSFGIITITVLGSKLRIRLVNMFHSIKRNKEPSILALCFIMLIFFALVIDLDLVHSDFLYLIEELFEMNAAIALMFGALSMNNQRHPDDIFEPSDD